MTMIELQKTISTKIKNMINSYDVWSPNASELCYKGNIPERLSELLSSILVKEGGKKASTALTVLNCIGQDIIYS